MLHSKLVESVKKHEGLRLSTYRDSLDVPTIGYGTNLLHLTITEELAEQWLLEKLGACQDALSLIPEYRNLDFVRRAVLVELAYNMGLAGLLTFTKMFASFRIKNFKASSRELLDSKYAAQVGNRAITLARRLRTGKWDYEGNT